MPQEYAIPAIVGAIVLAIVLLSAVSRLIARDRRKRPLDESTMQAERDVLRANHAAEVAALEARLAEALARPDGVEGGTLELQRAQKAAAELTAELEAVRGDAARHAASLEAQRDRATAEASRLREELHGTVNRLSQATAQATRSAPPAELAALEGEVRSARTEAEAMRRERAALRERLTEIGADAGASHADLSEAQEALAAAQRTVAEHERTIAELRTALEPHAADTGDDAEVARLTAALHAATERERIANDALSRLAYDLEGVKSRAATHERVEREVRVELEKAETLADLRLQKIYALEERLGEFGNQMRELQTRALKPASDEPADDRRARELEAQIETARRENAALVEELEALRRHALEAVEEDSDPAGAAAAADAVAQRALEARAAAIEAGLAPVRAKLREFAERFVAETEAAGADGEASEPSLAERIRAFKAARAREPV